MRDSQWIHRVPPSAERKSHASSSVFEQTTSNDIDEDRTELPSLPDLLDELEADVDLNSLEQLTQSLLQDIARDLEATAQKTDSETATSFGDRSGEMVGQTPTELEPSGVSTTDTKSLEIDISKYLLLHHNYAAKPPVDKPRRVKNSHTKSKKWKSIKPKHNNVIVPQPDVESQKEVMFGTLDEVTNVVTIIVDKDGIPVTEEALQRLEPEAELNLVVPSPVTQCLSPMSCSDSDRGYESLDSPVSLPEDIWDQSISELFPSLF